MQSCWVGSKQFSLVEFYLGLKIVYFYQVLLFQNHFRYVHMSDPIILGNFQRPMLSSQYTLANINDLLASNLRYLVNISWPILIMRVTTVQKKYSGCIQSNGCSLPISDIRGWFNLMLSQVDNLQIILDQNIPARIWISCQLCDINGKRLII